MIRLNVNLSDSCDVIIERALLNRAGDYLAKAITPRSKLCIVCDHTVYRLYAHKDSGFVNSLIDNGFSPAYHVFSPGESSKTKETVFDIVDTLIKAGFTRSDCVIALGGGVCGDIAGFAASVYMRGISYVQIPTTVLAMADSSIGGKTGVNIQAAKNIVGVFRQPNVVLVDPCCLITLPEKEFANGMAEVIKIAFAVDMSILPLITKKPFEAIIEAMKAKIDIVSTDEFDTGRRHILNFGHTIGHAIERCSGFAIPHGFAVINGMYLTALAAEHMGWCRESSSTLIREVIRSYGFPTVFHYDESTLYENALIDKKHTGDSITLIYPDCPGHCIMRDIPIEFLKEFIRTGLEEARKYEN